MGVQEIYDKLRTAPQHRASSVELFDEMTLQAGDVVTVSSDGQNYSVPIYAQDIHWTGAGMTVLENTGNEKREPLKAQKRRDFATNKRGYGNSKRQDGTDKWIEDFENTDLWVNQDTIWAVSGAYQVWTDPVSGVKHIQLKDGALLEVDRGDGVYSTVGTSYGITQVNNEVVNVIEGSALWTQRNNITGVCGEFTVITDTQTGKKRLKIANGTGLVMTRDNAEYGVYDDGNLTAGIIATIVNGETSTYIKGSKIYIGDQDAATVIAGKCSLSDVTATYISGQIATLTSLSVAALSATSTVGCATLQAGSIQLRTSSGSGYATSDIKDVFLSSIELRGPTNNVYSIYQHTANDATGVLVGTFSRAVSSFTGTWSGNHYQVTVSPQGQTGGDTYLYTSGDDWTDDNKKTIHVYYFSGETKVDVLTATVTAPFTQQTITLQGSQTSNITTQGTAATTTTVTLQGSQTSDLTLQGTAQTVYEEVSSGGTVYYTAGTAVTLYEAGTAVTRYKGNGGSFTVQGSSGPKLYHYGSATLKTSGGTELTQDWYYVSNSSRATQYYNAGSTTKTARGDSESITPIGTSKSITPIGSTSKRLSSVTRYKAGTNVGKLYNAGTVASYYPATETLYKAGTNIGKLYNAGTISTAYYTRNY